MCPGVGLEGGLRWSARPFGGVEGRGHARCPAFAPSSSEVAVELFWSFCILLSVICPSCPCTQLFLVPYSLFVFCCWRRSLSWCKHYSKGSQVPGPSLAHPCRTGFTSWVPTGFSPSPRRAPALTFLHAYSGHCQIGGTPTQTFCPFSSSPSAQVPEPCSLQGRGPGPSRFQLP